VVTHRNPFKALLENGNGPLTYHLYFEKFAEFRWTYIAGYRELLHTFLLVETGFNSSSAVNELIIGERVRAITTIPQSLRNVWTEGDWTRCDRAQILRACKTEPLRFDRACQAIQALAIAYRSAIAPELRNLPIFSFINLHPATFVLRDLDERVVAFLKRTRLTSREEKLFRTLVREICPKDGRNKELGRSERAVKFLAVAAQGHGMTWPNAICVRDFLVSKKIGWARVEMLTDRSDGGKMIGKKSCNSAESVFISLPDEKLKNLAEIIRAKPCLSRMRR
jgi:hypothetical protein